MKIGRYPNRSAAVRDIKEEKLADENYFIQKLTLKKFIGLRLYPTIYEKTILIFD